MPDVCVTSPRGTRVHFEACETCPLVEIAAQKPHRLFHFLILLRSFQFAPVEEANQFADISLEERMSELGFICGAAVCALCPSAPTTVQYEFVNGTTEKEDVTPAYILSGETQTE